MKRNTSIIRDPAPAFTRGRFLSTAAKGGGLASPLMEFLEVHAHRQKPPAALSADDDQPHSSELAVASVSDGPA